MQWESSGRIYHPWKEKVGCEPVPRPRGDQGDARASVYLRGTVGLIQVRIAGEEQTAQTYTEPPLMLEEIDNTRGKAIHANNSPRILG